MPLFIISKAVYIEIEKNTVTLKIDIGKFDENKINR